MSKTVIISGGMLDEGFAEKVLEANPEAYIIAVDKGLYSKGMQEKTQEN